MKKILAFNNKKKFASLFIFLFITSIICIAFPSNTMAASGSPSTKDLTEREASIASPNEIEFPNLGASFLAGLADIMVESTYQLAAYSAKLLSWVIGDIVNKPITTDGNFTPAWKTSRDLGNMVIVLVFVVIGIATALRIQEYAAKKLLFPLIIVAILINFSGLFCGLIIDAANITMNGMGGSSGGTLPITVMNKLWTASYNNIPRAGMDGAGAGQMLTYSAMFAWMYIGVALTFLYLSIILVARYAVLVFLYILSPLAFALMTFPATKKAWSEWKDNFLKWAFIGVFGTLVLVLSTSLLGNFNAITKTSDIIIRGTVFLMFLFAGFKMTAQQGGVAALATAAVGGMALGAGKLAMGMTAGGAAGAAKIADRLTGNRASAGLQKLKSGYGKQLEKVGLRAIGSTAGSNTKQVDDIAGTMGKEYEAADASGDQGSMDRIHRLATKGHGAQAAAAMKVLTSSGNLKKAFTDKNGNFNTSAAAARLSYAESNGAVDLKSEAVKKNYQLAAALKPERVTNFMNSHKGISNEQAIRSVNREQLATNLPNMSTSDLGKIDHKDLQGTEGFDFVKDNFTPSTINKISVSGSRELKSTLKSNANLFGLGAGVAASSGDQKEAAKMRKMSESLKRL